MHLCCRLSLSSRNTMYGRNSCGFNSEEYMKVIREKPFCLFIIGIAMAITASASTMYIIRTIERQRTISKFKQIFTRDNSTSGMPTTKTHLPSDVEEPVD
nr:MAG: hypothetical protein [Penaeus semisulcatus pemonivirus]